MLPKEYGTWAMLLVPLGVGLAVAGNVGAEGVVFGLASLSMFMARYPLTLMAKAWLGRSKSVPERSVRSLAVYSLLSLGLAVPLLYPYRLWWLVPLGGLAFVFLLASLYMLRERWERTEAGELLGIAGLTLTAPGAYYAASGEMGTKVVFLWLLCALYFGASVFYVKMRLRHRGLKQGAPEGSLWVMGRSTALYCLGLLAIVLVLAALRQIPVLAAIAFAPLLLKCLLVIFRPSPGMTLRQVGIAEVWHSALFGVLLAVAYRYSA